MKKIIITATILLASYVSTAQKSGAFVRVFDNKNSKFQKGHLLTITDSSMVLLNGKDTVEVAAKTIGSIKMRRSFGHTVALTTGISAASLALIGAFTGEKKTNGTSIDAILSDLFTYTPAEGVTAGLIGGSAIGLVTGSIIAGTRKKPTLIVNNSLEKWQQAKQLLKPYLPLQNGTN